MGTLRASANRGGVVGGTAYVGRTKWARAYYDFATDGGAVSAITLRGDKIPSGAVVLSAVIKVATAVTSGGSATASIGVESAVDLRAVATDLTTAPSLATTGNKLMLATRATAPISTTADRDIIMTVATAALTAGRFSVLVEYLELSANV